MTVKSVLDQFSEAKLLRYISGFEGSIRTELHQCPLQLATSAWEGYIAAAYRLGLEDAEVVAIMNWADFGVWSIKEFGKNPMKEAKQ